MTDCGCIEQRFEPRSYLRHYFSIVDHESDILLRFLSRVVNTHRFAGATVLDIGCGPTLYSLISAARDCATIHLSDYLPENLEEIRLWLDRAHHAFDWTPFIHRGLEHERGLEQERTVGSTYSAVSASQLVERAETMRRAITKLVPGDVRQPAPLGEAATGAYDIVITLFCLEAAATSANEWRQCIEHIASLLKPKGLLVLATLIESSEYRVGNQQLSTSYISREMHETALQNAGFADMQFEYVGADDPSANAYQGALLGTAYKR